MTKKINLKKIIILSSAIIGGFLLSLTLSRCGDSNKILKHSIKSQEREATQAPQLIFDSSQISQLNNNDHYKTTYYWDFEIVIQNQNNDLFYIENSQKYNLSLIVDYADLYSVNIVVNGSRLLTFNDMQYSFIVDITTSSSFNTYVQFTSSETSLIDARVHFQLVAIEKQDNDSYNDGYNDGLEIGKTQGRDIGYLEGYDAGIIAGGNINSVEWLKNTFNSVASILTIEPFPGLSFATILSIPLIVSVVQFILGWFI